MSETQQLPMFDVDADFQVIDRCPFCGSSRNRVKSVWKTYRFVACLDCKAGGPVCRTEEEAIAAWNRRVDDGRM